MDEPVAISPLWIEYSGLPAQLNDEIRSGAWIVFKKLLELDCQQNAIPDIIEAAPEEIAGWTGVKPEIVVKILNKLRQRKYLAASMGEHPGEPGLFQIQIPLHTPRKAVDVLRESGKAFFRPGMKLRYAFPITEPPGDEARMQQVVDLYFNNIGMRMNSFILDELRLIGRRFSLDSIRKVFGRAALNEVRELGWAVRELIKESPKGSE
jgi:hypothetical protein